MPHSGSIGSILRKIDADRAQKDQFGPIRKNPNSLLSNRLVFQIQESIQRVYSYLMLVQVGLELG